VLPRWQKAFAEARKLAQFPNAQRRVRRIPIRDRAVLADLGDPIDRDTVRLNGALNERQKVQPNR
jgi:hypothetical protein